MVHCVVAQQQITFRDGGVAPEMFAELHSFNKVTVNCT